MSSTDEDVTTVSFNLNNEIVNIEVPINCDLRNLLENDDDYTVRYIEEMVQNGFLTLGDPLRKIERITNEESILIWEYIPDESKNEKSKSNEWSEPETKLLLDKYELNYPMIGPMNKFKLKKNMWEQIAIDIKNIFNARYSTMQVENRYKTILKRKKNAIYNNNKTGSARMCIPYDEELKKIAAIDDSIQPEVAGSSGGVRILKKSESGKPSSSEKKRKKCVEDLLLDLHNKREMSRERRHQEKLSLIKELFNSK